MSAPIVLLTDFGLRDHYVGSLHGVILSIHPKANIVDLSHGIGPQNVAQGAAILEVSYSLFPKGSVFVCVVDPGVGTRRMALAVKTKNYYFVAPDNGLLEPTLQHEKGLVIRSVENKKFFRTEQISSTFHGRDIFSPTGAHLAKSGKPSQTFDKLGPRLKKIKSLNLPKIKKTPKYLEGEILYFDHFGNAIANIHRRDHEDAFWQKAQFWVKDIPLGKLERTYGTAKRSLIALFESSDRLEIAAPGGSAYQTASLSVGDPVTAKLK